VSYSALTNLECPRCGAVLDADRVQGACSCGSPLLARYDLDQVRRAVTPEQLSTRGPSLWRYHELLPVRSADRVTSLGEGVTPLLPLRRLGTELGLPRLLMKDEGLIPTGSFKARGAAVGVSRAAELGVTGVAMPTNGNAGAAWSAYAARAGLRALIAMPVGAPQICRSECVAAGAALYLVDGLIGDAAALIRQAVGQQPGYQDVSTLREPYRIEGKKTMGLEIAEQLGWRWPDVIICPTGGGVGVIGIHKALGELRDLGWVHGKLPRLVAVQAAGCAPVVAAFQRRARDSTEWAGAHTVAFGLNVPKALGDFLILEALYQTGGAAVAVSDTELLHSQRECARREGAFICPEGAAALSAARKLREAGWLDPDDEVVVLNTGAGMKYPETVAVEAPVLARGDSIPAVRPLPGSDARDREPLHPRDMAADVHDDRDHLAGGGVERDPERPRACLTASGLAAVGSHRGAGPQRVDFRPEVLVHTGDHSADPHWRRDRRPIGGHVEGQAGVVGADHLPGGVPPGPVPHQMNDCRAAQSPVGKGEPDGDPGVPTREGVPHHPVDAAKAEISLRERQRRPVRAQMPGLVAA
jgi:threonine synthase